MASTRLTDLELRAWQSLLHAHHDVVGALDADLQEQHGISFSEYDALLRLARAPERVLTMGELAERTMLSPSGTTRLVDRLVARDLIRRRPAPADGRVTMATLTPAGVTLLRAAARTHLRGIREHFSGRFTARQLEQVASALEAIAGPHVPH
ncbi:MAG: MarR family winged helix-turn-helix transcriptional regulator [Actinomycetota bacterium]